MTDRCSMERRSFPPGEHGRRRVKESDYLLQLREKQKARRVYGIMERQFRSYYRQALREKGKTGENLIRILESRLDNVVYRAGFASSRKQARQLVNHGHVTVEGKKVDIASYQVSEGKAVAVAAKSKGLDMVKAALSGIQREVPGWLQVDKKKLEAIMVERPAGESIDVPIRDEMIVELYSR
jgi:small subunit ribosomal protein S4